MYRHVWTPAQLQFIRDNAAILKDIEIAAALCRITGHHITLDQVRKARQDLGIVKAQGKGVCEVIEVRKT